MANLQMMDIFGLLMVLTAAFAYVNCRYIKLPTTSGVMLLGLFGTLSLLGLQKFGFDFTQFAHEVLNKIDFEETLMNGMLSVLLFAGAFQVNLKELGKQKGVVSVLSTFGLLLSTTLTAGMCLICFQLLNLPINFTYCLIFGALISPTDPIAVLALLKQSGAPASVQAKIAGESLFNDGVGVVLFVSLLKFATGSDPTLSEIASLFLREGVGGLILGVGIGSLAFVMLKSIDNYSVEVLITVAVVFGGYSLARSLHLSGPLAMVAAGLIVGNQGRAHAMSDETRIHLSNFWELSDEILNSLLFAIIGLEIIVIPFDRTIALAAIFVVPIVFFARFISVAVPVKAMSRFRSFSPNLIKIMTWGGLKGGISIALALSLPPSPVRNLLIAVTYILVVISVGIQATLFPLVLRRFPPR